MNYKRNVEIISKVINEFLNRHNLLKEEPPWVLGNSPLGGVGVFARRDIVTGEEILRDFPIVIGPRTITNSPVFCVVCYQPNDLKPCPQNCGLPLCSLTCEQNHKLECEVIRKKRKLQTTTVDEPLFRNSTPLRSLLLDEDDKKIIGHLKYHRGEIHGFEIDKLKEIDIDLDEWEEEYLRLVCCVMDANAFEVVVGNGRNSTNLRGLYPLSSLLNHSCAPNTMHIFDENQLMIVRACVFIKKGEEIFHSYERLICSTPVRIYHLLKTKHFLCRCSRCSDPTEFGSYMSAFLCKSCKGNVIPKNSLNLKSDWICEDCHSETKRTDIANLFNMLGSILRSFDGENLDAMLKFLNGRLPQIVAPNNEILVELKYKMIWIIGYHAKYKWTDVDDGMLDLKKTMCEDLLKLVDILRLGECKLKALLLYELYSCLKEKCRRSQLSAADGFDKDNVEVAENILHEVAILSKDDVSAPEEIKKVIKDIENICID